MDAAGDSELARLAQAVAAALGSSLKLVTVESCTGGYVAKLLTDVAGSSQWFEAGYVTYSNAAKQRDAGVHAQTLLRHGSVSEAVVREMAAGGLARSGADVAISISGVAGPDGGTARNPVGSVWFALARRDGDAVICDAQYQQLAGDRDAVRRQSAAVALKWLLSGAGGVRHA
jgi:nicotinamide-nucleotide amidase